jgi:histone-lysine N-methyltransferase SETD3
VRVLPPGGGAPCSALLPEALLLNHSVAPHVVRFSAPDADGVLRLRALRPCHAGAQLFLSYGPLPNAQLLQFYGFCLPDNPYDTFPMAFELPEEEEGEAQEGEETALLRACVLERWGLGLEHSLRRGHRLPSRLLGALRVLTASSAELAACSASPRTVPLSADNEQTVALTLADTVEALLASIPPVPQPGGGGGEDAAALAHCATYLQGQRDILCDAQRQCADMLAACLGAL